MKINWRMLYSLWSWEGYSTYFSQQATTTAYRIKEKIFDEVRGIIGAKFEKRIHLLEKRDLHNIGRAFGLDEVERHGKDQESRLSWIKEWENTGNNPVLYYKLQS